MPLIDISELMSRKEGGKCKTGCKKKEKKKQKLAALDKGWCNTGNKMRLFI